VCVSEWVRRSGIKDCTIWESLVGVTLRKGFRSIEPTQYNLLDLPGRESYLHTAMRQLQILKSSPRLQLRTHWKVPPPPGSSLRLLLALQHGESQTRCISNCYTWRICEKGFVCIYYLCVCMYMCVRTFVESESKEWSKTSFYASLNRVPFINRQKLTATLTYEVGWSLNNGRLHVLHNLWQVCLIPVLLVESEAELRRQPKGGRHNI
jgi:hypothetical protein